MIKFIESLSFPCHATRKRVRNRTPLNTLCSMRRRVSFFYFRSDAKCHGSVNSTKVGISYRSYTNLTAYTRLKRSEKADSTRYVQYSVVIPGDLVIRWLTKGADEARVPHTLGGKHRLSRNKSVPLWDFVALILSLPLVPLKDFTLLTLDDFTCQWGTSPNTVPGVHPHYKISAIDPILDNFFPFFHFFLFCLVRSRYSWDTKKATISLFWEQKHGWLKSTQKVEQFNYLRAIYWW